MQNLLVAVVFAGVALGGPVLAVASQAARPGQPVLVVSAPWGEDRAALIARAGGRPVGPADSWLAGQAVGTGPDFADNLRAGGAWLVLDATAIARLCGRT